MFSARYVITLLLVIGHILSFTVFLAESEFVWIIRVFSVIPAIVFLRKTFKSSDLIILSIYLLSIRNIQSLYYIIIYISIILVVRNCSKEFLKVSRVCLTCILFINLFLVYAPQSLIETWELRGGSGVRQYSGIFTSPTSLGLILVLSFTRGLGHKNFIFSSMSIFLGLLTRSRQYLIGLILALWGHRWLRLVLITVIIIKGQVLWKIINISNIDGRILGSRTEVYELFYLFIKENFRIFGLGLGSSSLVVESYLGHDYSFHSSYLNLIVEMGVLSIVVIFVFLRKFIETRLLVFVLLSFTTSIFDYPTALLFPWVYWLTNESITSYRSI